MDDLRSTTLNPTQTGARWVLAVFLMVAGLGHFVSREAFAAQVPPALPFPDFIVIASGVVEIGLAIALVGLARHRAAVGWIVALFFVLVFPGNLAQFFTRADAFGLDTDVARGVRLLFQPLLVVWALWCTGAWQTWRGSRAATPPHTPPS
mgnify:FL=1